LRCALAALFASAGGGAALQVSEWHDGFAIGAPDFDRVPSMSQAVVLGAECDPASLGAAAGLMLSLERERCFLAVHGDVAALDRSVDRGATPAIRFPALGRSELEAIARGVPLGLTKGPFGQACLGLAQAIVARYRQLER
jgi:hypothetical protein